MSFFQQVVFPFEIPIEFHIPPDSIFAAIGRYFKPTGTDSYSKSRDYVRWGAAGVTFCYGVGLVYRSGIMETVLAPALYRPIENTVEKIKAHTQPIVDPKKFAVLRRHLITTYTHVTAAYLLTAAGTATFFHFPDLPVAVAMASTATSALAVGFGAPYMSRLGQTACFALMAYSCGVSLGPINWIALDSLGPALMVISSTTIGFSVPLFLTRGVVSYFMSTQLLSYSLAIVTSGVSLCMNPATYDAAARSGWYGKSLQQVEGDVNVLIAIQMVANTALAALHTLPTMYRFLHSKEDMAKIEEDECPVRQASIIYGTSVYVFWRIVRYCLSVALRTIARSQHRGMTEDERRQVQALENGRFLTIPRMSNIGSSVMMIIAYVRIVSSLQAQGGGASPNFERTRRYVNRVSPLRFH